MTMTSAVDPFGVLTDPTTLRMQRLLPGPIEPVWDHLTQSDLRRRWFAAGDMKMEVGASFEFLWRNDELTNPPGIRPEGVSGENRMQSRITEVDPPRKLAFTWGANGDVSFELTAEGSDVLLTLVHRGVPDRASLLSFAPGWHTHLNVLETLFSGGMPEPFWDGVVRLRGEYGERLPA